MMKTGPIKVVPKSVAYADFEKSRLILEYTIPGAPIDTIDVVILDDCIRLKAPASDIEYVSIMVLDLLVKPEITDATYENGLLRIEVPIKDPMDGAAKIDTMKG